MILGMNCEKSQTRGAGLNALLPAEGTLPHPASLWLCTLGIVAQGLVLVSSEQNMLPRLAFGRPCNVFAKLIQAWLCFCVSKGCHILT